MSFSQTQHPIQHFPMDLSKKSKTKSYPILESEPVLIRRPEDDLNFPADCQLLAVSMEDENLNSDLYPGKDLICVPFGPEQMHGVFHIAWAKNVPEDVIPEKMYLKRGNGMYVRYEPVWKKMRK